MVLGLWLFFGLLLKQNEMSQGNDNLSSRCHRGLTTGPLLSSGQGTDKRISGREVFIAWQIRVRRGKNPWKPSTKQCLCTTDTSDTLVPNLSVHAWGVGLTLAQTHIPRARQEVSTASPSPGHLSQPRLSQGASAQVDITCPQDLLLK